MPDISSTPTKAKKDRSPSFPFIPLGTAVDRLIAFDAKFGRHPTPANKVGLAWGFKEGSSQADQTLAALRSFGLVIYKGIGPKREVSISEEGRTYLRAEQEVTKASIIKSAALRPRLIRKLWLDWREDRPIDPIALEKLKFDFKFSDSGAPAFLKIYDATVAYAKLSASDKVPDNLDQEDEEPEGENGGKSGNLHNPPPPLSPIKRDPVKLMEGERELTTGLLSKDANFRLIVSGTVGVKEIERLIAKLELDKEILAETDDEPGSLV